MEVAHRDDEVDRVGTGIGGEVDILGERPDIRARFGGEPGIGDCTDGLAFPEGSGRRAGFDDVDADVGKVRCNLKFLGRRQADTRCLFAVP